MNLKNIFSKKKVTDVASLKKSKAFCMAPWVHLYVSPFGKVFPCCLIWDEEMALGNVNEQPIEQIWNSSKMKEFRCGMMQDKKNSFCHQCHESERLGVRSNREIINNQYADKLDWVNTTKKNGYSVDAKPIYWDIRISNLCNFKCRICGHHSSSKWYDDAKELGLSFHEERVHYSIQDLNDVLNQLEPYLPYLEEVHFAGGEPLIMEEQYQILDLLIKHKRLDVTLRYTTNFSETVFKGRDIYKDWKQFEKVYVCASLDGMGKKGELQRKGQKWATVLENRKRLEEVCPNVKFLVAPTISIFNVHHLPDFHRHWTELGFIRVEDFIPHLLHVPAPYSIKVLPSKMKKIIVQKYQQHIEWVKSFTPQSRPQYDIVLNEFESCLEYMNSEDRSDLLPKFRKMTNDLDQLRTEKTLDVFPELKEILD